MNIRELAINSRINDVIYQVRNASFREGDGAKGYYLMRLGDRTGQIDAIWLNASDVDLKVGDFVKVEAKVQKYQGRLQLKINTCHKIDPETIDHQNYNLSAVNKKELLDKLHHYVESIEIKPLYDVIKHIIFEELYDDFCNAPAATFNHHSYIGGLLEHSISVTEICNACIPLYKGVNKDILIAGALIHDIGKVYEFEFGESISYTTKGNLFGHIFMGANKFQQECDRLTGFPEFISNHLIHIILSHHGLMERGSPVEPRTLEAILVHKADTADADANAFKLSEIESAGGNWLISRTLNRIIYLETESDFEMRKSNE
jgi:3'-5' exoribonuclease